MRPRCKINKKDRLKIAQPITKKTATLISDSSNFPGNALHGGPSLLQAVLSVHASLHRHFAHTAHHSLHKGVLLSCRPFDALQVRSQGKKSSFPSISLAVPLRCSSSQEPGEEVFLPKYQPCCSPSPSWLLTQYRPATSPELGEMPCQQQIWP